MLSLQAHESYNGNFLRLL